MDGVHFAAVPAPSLAHALPAGWGTEASAFQYRARLRGCVHHPLRHHSESHTRQLRTHPRPLCLLDCRTGTAGTLPRVADERISFSRMTFTHQMIRLLLVEQIYRAFKISRGEKYHW